MDKIMKVAENPEHLAAFYRRSIIVKTGGKDDEIGCMFGLMTGSVLGDFAYLWLLTTPLVDEYPFVFVRRSQIEVRKMLETYPIIRGHVLEDNRRAIRWLKWLGVKLKGCENHMIQFELRAS
jgi:hypothetical protein